MTRAARLRGVVRSTLFRFGRAVLRRPRLKRLAKSLLALAPALRTRVQAGMYEAALASHIGQSNRIKDDADLSPRTIRMLHALDQGRGPEAPP